MKTTDFSKARVGDKVFDRFRQEWGIISKIDNHNEFPIVVYFCSGFIIYSLEGFRGPHDKIPALVWAEQKLKDDWSILPEMPKRMIKKKIEGWINLYRYKPEYQVNNSNEKMLAATSYVFPTKEMALKYRVNTHLGEPLFISHEYEVEE